MAQIDFKTAQPLSGQAVIPSRRVVAWAGSVVGCYMLLVLAAHVRVPVPGTEVPMTLQLLAVLLTGFALPPGRAVLATTLYLISGVAGLAVFAGSAGLAGSTGGYLVGFVVGAWVVSTLKGQAEAGLGRLLLSGAAGVAAVFTLGIAWRVGLALLLGFSEGNVGLVITTGLLPFVVKAVVELLIAVALIESMRGLRWRLGRSSPGGD